MSKGDTRYKKVTFGIALTSLVIAIGSCFLSIRADHRARKLYEAQRISAIHVNPISFEEYFFDDATMGRMIIQVTNYTGFKVLDLNIDVSFENQWNRQWRIAAVKGLSEMEVRGELTDRLKTHLEGYKADLAQNSYSIKPNTYILFESRGGIKFDRKKPKIILIRCNWKSENGAFFDRIFKYELISTQAYGKESFTLIPKD
jgi:hypothetical protein